MPLEIQNHTVPHLKALIIGKNEPRGLRYGSTFNVCQAFLKSVILLHKEAYRADLFSSECMCILLHKEATVRFGPTIAVYVGIQYLIIINYNGVGIPDLFLPGLMVAV